MAKVVLDSWEREPLWLKALTPILKARRFPVLPPRPERGKWYRFHPDGAVSANGDPAFADVRLGTENKLLVFFCGGGVSVDEYTAARPASMYSRERDDMFYLTRLDLFGDLAAGKGILDNHPDNPFRDWTKVMITYATGDFHVGTKDFPYTALDGSSRVLHHHGYLNYRAVMAEVQKLMPTPESMVVAGCSGGAWGAALLADDVISHFPECPRIVCCIDSALGLKNDWPRIATDVWGAPAQIVARLQSNDMVTDSLSALAQSHGDRVTCLYATSVRDSGLARMQNYLDGKRLVFTRESGDKLQNDIADMAARLMREIPGIGLFLFNAPDPGQKSLGLTKHCVIGDRGFHHTRSDRQTARDWIWDAVNGDVRSYGHNLLTTGHRNERDRRDRPQVGV
jgi:hypothetical protein